MATEKKCPKCKGIKYILVSRRAHPVPHTLHLGNILPKKPREWRRLGDLDKKDCPTCNGTGKVKEE